MTDLLTIDELEWILVQEKQQNKLNNEESDHKQAFTVENKSNSKMLTKRYNREQGNTKEEESHKCNSNLTSKGKYYFCSKPLQKEIWSVETKAV